MTRGRREFLAQAAAGAALALGLAGAVGSRTPAEAQASGRWVGSSTGGGPECGVFTFDLLLRGGTIGGRATTFSRSGQSVDWQATGFVKSGGRVELTTITSSARVSAPRQAITWTGEITSGRLTLSQRASVGCSIPQSAVLMPG